MAQTDTLDKIIGTYFALVCAEDFGYKGRVYKARPLSVSPLIFRGFTCPAMCGGCCPRFSLDYLPSERRPASLDLQPRTIDILRGSAARDDVEMMCVTVLSDLQNDRRGERHCRNLNMDDGRCGVHGVQPFSCDFELIRFIEYADVDRPNVMLSKLFGRGWNMMRVDGERGALCEMTDADEQSVRDTLRKAKRLKEWVEHFGIAHKMDAIIDWIAAGPHSAPLVLGAAGDVI